MGSTQLGGCIGYFLKFLFSNFCSHIKDSKWGRNIIFVNYTCCNGSPQKIPFQFANGKLPYSRCKAFWANQGKNLTLNLLPTLSQAFYYGNECKLQLNAMQWFENAILACFCYVCASSSVFRSDWEAKTWRDQGCTSSRAASEAGVSWKTWLRPNSQSEISELSASEWCITWSPLFWLVIMPSQRENKGLKLQTFKDEDLHTGTP